MSSQPFLRLLRSRATQVRSFTHSTPVLARHSKRPPPAVPSYESKPKHAQKAVALARHQPPPPAVRSETPPAAQTLTPAKIQNYASAILGNADELLLYKAPRNIALFNTSMITGGAIQFWVSTVANTSLNLSVPWYAKSVILAGCFVSSAMAVAMMLTPYHLVKSISLVRTAEKEVVMRVKGTRFFPFMKPAVFDLVPGQMTVDNNVTMSLEATRQWWGVPLKNGKAWTEGSLRRPDEPQGNAITKLNKSLLNISPAAFSQVRKMFNRDGMAYARIGNGNWKMDLENCEILENGSVLMELVKEGVVRTSLVSMASRSLFSK